MSEVICRILRYVQQFPLLRHHHDESGHRLEKPHETCKLRGSFVVEITIKDYNEREDAVARKEKKKEKKKDKNNNSKQLTK
jgi:hypothetical protein